MYSNCKIKFCINVWLICGLLSILHSIKALNVSSPYNIDENLLPNSNKTSKIRPSSLEVNVDHGQKVLHQYVKLPRLIRDENKKILDQNSRPEDDQFQEIYQYTILNMKHLLMELVNSINGNNKSEISTYSKTCFDNAYCETKTIVVRHLVKILNHLLRSLHILERMDNRLERNKVPTMIDMNFTSTKTSNSTTKLIKPKHLYNHDDENKSKRSQFWRLIVNLEKLQKLQYNRKSKVDSMKMISNVPLITQNKSENFIENQLAKSTSYNEQEQKLCTEKMKTDVSELLKHLFQTMTDSAPKNKTIFTVRPLNLGEHIKLVNLWQMNSKIVTPRKITKTTKTTTTIVSTNKKSSVIFPDLMQVQSYLNALNLLPVRNNNTTKLDVFVAPATTENPVYTLKTINLNPTIDSRNKEVNISTALRNITTDRVLYEDDSYEDGNYDPVVEIGGNQYKVVLPGINQTEFRKYFAKHFLSSNKSINLLEGSSSMLQKLGKSVGEVLNFNKTSDSRFSKIENGIGIKNLENPQLPAVNEAMNTMKAMKPVTEFPTKIQLNSTLGQNNGNVTAQNGMKINRTTGSFTEEIGLGPLPRAE